MVPEFYEGREIFFTGGSGIIGKALIEKLLRSCNVGKIYMLLRPKKFSTIEERLEEIKQDTIYRRLMKEKPNEFKEKIVPVSGDVALPMMGITSDNSKLMENVTIVFHVAATVRFDEPLRHAIKLNVGGTLEVLKFAETLKKLEVFMHVSTFYSNPYLEYVDAKWYEAPMDWQICLDLSRRNDIADETLDALTRKLITGFPNTYCFTKNIAESLVNQYRNKLPVAICRPSIVVSAAEEPEPGYPTSMSGAMGLFALSSAGILKVIYAAKDQRCDFLVLDVAVKSMLYYVLKTQTMYANGRRPASIPVLHITSRTHLDLGIRDWQNITQQNGVWEEAALEKSLLIPGVIFTESRILFKTLVMLKHILLALLVDLLLILSGRKPVLMKVQRKLYVSLELLKPFMFNNYDCSGVTYYEEMLDVLSGTDFNVESLKKCKNHTYTIGMVRNMYYKIREVLFKEDPSTLPRSRMILKIKIITYRIIQMLLAYKMYNMVRPMISNWYWMDVDMDSVNHTMPL